MSLSWKAEIERLTAALAKAQKHEGELEARLTLLREALDA